MYCMYLDSLWEYKCVCITWRRAQTSAEKRIVSCRARARVCVWLSVRARACCWFCALLSYYGSKLLYGTEVN